MLVDLFQKIETRWSGRNYRQFVSNGYAFTKMGDAIVVKLTDLPKCSRSKIEVKCDYCGKIFEVAYSDYNVHHQGIIAKDCCMSCIPVKIKESNLAIYGTTHYNKLPEMIEKTVSKTRKSFSDVRDSFAALGLHLIEGQKYKNKDQLLQYVCEHHIGAGIQEKCYGSVRNGQGCPYCFHDRFSGENHWKYNSNLSDDERKMNRDFKEYKKWRNSVYAKDNYSCQCCGDRIGGNLIAHHLASYSDNPEQRTTITNGITLCETCHGEFHKEFGFGLNTPEQFTEFVRCYKNKEFSAGA